MLLLIAAATCRAQKLYYELSQGKGFDDACIDPDSDCSLDRVFDALNSHQTLALLDISEFSRFSVLYNLTSLAGSRVFSRGDADKSTPGQLSRAEFATAYEILEQHQQLVRKAQGWKDVALPVLRALAQAHGKQLVQVLSATSVGCLVLRAAHRGLGNTVTGLLALLVTWASVLLCPLLAAGGVAKIVTDHAVILQYERSFCCFFLGSHLSLFTIYLATFVFIRRVRAVSASVPPRRRGMFAPYTLACIILHGLVFCAGSAATNLGFYLMMCSLEPQTVHLAVALAYLPAMGFYLSSTGRKQ